MTTRPATHQFAKQHPSNTAAPIRIAERAVRLALWLPKWASTASAASGATSTAPISRRTRASRSSRSTTSPPPDVLAHMLKYDSTHGVLDARRSSTGEGRSRSTASSFEVLSEREPTALPWKDMGVDVVVESTGPLHRPRRRVTAPGRRREEGRDLGSRDRSGRHARARRQRRPYDPEQHHIISNASCTTNSVAPMAKILLDAFGLEAGFMTTIHAYTTEQQLQDQIASDAQGQGRPAPDARGAAEHHPGLDRSGEGDRRGDPRAEGQARRDGDARARPGRERHRPRLRARPRGERRRGERRRTAGARSSDHWAGILQYTEDPIVSSDIVGNSYSCIIDGLSTMAHGNQVKVIGWYDNEWGYSCRLVDVIDRLL